MLLYIFRCWSRGDWLVCALESVGFVHMDILTLLCRCVEAMAVLTQSLLEGRRDLDDGCSLLAVTAPYFISLL